MSTTTRNTTRAGRTRLHPQFLTDAKGKRTSVLLPMREFEALIEELEDRLDAEEADRILANLKPGDLIPMEQVMKEFGL